MTTSVRCILIPVDKPCFLARFSSSNRASPADLSDCPSCSAVFTNNSFVFVMFSTHSALTLSLGSPGTANVTCAKVASNTDKNSSQLRLLWEEGFSYVLKSSKRYERLFYYALLRNVCFFRQPAIDPPDVSSYFIARQVSGTNALPLLTFQESPCIVPQLQCAENRYVYVETICIELGRLPNRCYDSVG